MKLRKTENLSIVFPFVSVGMIGSFEFLANVFVNIKKKLCYLDFTQQLRISYAHLKILHAGNHLKINTLKKFNLQFKFNFKFVLQNILSLFDEPFL